MATYHCGVCETDVGTDQRAQHEASPAHLANVARGGTTIKGSSIDGSSIDGSSIDDDSIDGSSID